MRPATVDAVLSRLGVDRPAPDLAGLRMVYAAWCGAVPFDNSRKMIHVAEARPGPLPGSTAEDFFSAWLAFGTGAAPDGSLTASPLGHEGRIRFLVEELGVAEDLARRLPYDQPVPPRPAGRTRGRGGRRELTPSRLRPSSAGRVTRERPTPWRAPACSHLRR
jgi:hypothetical protein